MDPLVALIVVSRNLESQSAAVHDRSLLIVDPTLVHLLLLQLLRTHIVEQLLLMLAPDLIYRA